MQGSTFGGGEGEPSWVNPVATTEKTPLTSTTRGATPPPDTYQNNSAVGGGLGRRNGGGSVVTSTKDVHRGWILSYFLWVNLITIVSALSVAVAQVLSIVYKKLAAEAIAIRVYGIIFCLVVVVAEMGVIQAVREMIFVKNWVSRGAFYAFVGLLVVEETEMQRTSLSWVNRYIMDVGYIMITIGVLYAIMGLLCLKRIKDEKAARYRTLLAHAEMAEALQAQEQISV